MMITLSWAGTLPESHLCVQIDHMHHDRLVAGLRTLVGVHLHSVGPDCPGLDEAQLSSVGPVGK